MPRKLKTREIRQHCSRHFNRRLEREKTADVNRVEIRSEWMYKVRGPPVAPPLGTRVKPG